MGKESFKFEDDDDSKSLKSLQSLDLEEARAMFRESPEQFSFTEPTRRSRIRTFCVPCSFILNAVLFVLTLAILGDPCYFSSRHCVYEATKTQIIGESESLKLLSEEHGFVPEFSLEKVVFMNDSRYSDIDMFKNAAKYDKILQEWEDYMPIGRGFVAISDEALPYLSRPYHLRVDPTLNGYSIASLHQYHCLYMILRGFGDFRFDRPAHNPDHERHVTHCFDYLRQSVLCAGDNTLEGESESVNRMTDGWGNTHICKKKDEYLQWVRDNRLSNYTGIH